MEPTSAIPLTAITETAGIVPQTLPRRLSVDRASPHFNVIYKLVGVRFNGVERRGDVQEYDADAGWIIIRKRDAQRRFLRENGKYVFEKLEGRVEPFLLSPNGRHAGQTEEAAAAAIFAAEAKRQRRAAKLAKVAT